MPTRLGATTVTARRGPHFVDGKGVTVVIGGLSGRVVAAATAAAAAIPLPFRSSQTRFVRERGRLSRRDLLEIQNNVFFFSYV